jgi:hypothetical protein
MQAIEQAELMREHGETESALAALCAIRSKAASDGNLEAVGLPGFYGYQLLTDLTILYRRCCVGFVLGLLF